MISIAMATYNGENYIREQLDSVLVQTINDFELIICDDCSKDSTIQILKEYEQKDNRIHVYFNENNLGFKKNFEKIMNLCKGDYIAFCDQDDIWTPDHLEVLLNNIGTHDMIGGNAELIDMDGKSMGYTMKDVLNISYIPDDKKLLGDHLLHTNVFQGTASMITSSLKQKMLPIPELVPFHDYWAAIIASFFNGCVYVDDVILKYRQHGGNVTENKKFSYKRIIKGWFNKNKIRKSLKEQISFLSMLLEAGIITDIEQINKIKDARKYYEDIYNHKNISVVKYFIHNYDSIYYGQVQSKKLKIGRFIKKLLGL